MSFNKGSGFTINGGAFNNVHGHQYNTSGNTNNHIAGDMNSYHTENHGNNNVNNSEANNVARPRRGQRRPHLTPRYDDGYKVEEEYNADDRPRIPYHPVSNPNDAHHPPHSMGYDGYGPEPPYPQREHSNPNAYEPRHISPPRRYGPAPQREAYPGDYDPRYNPQHQSYRDDRQQPTPRDYYDDRGYSRPPPAHYDRYYDPELPHPQYYPSGAPRPAPTPSSARADMEQGLPNQYRPQPHRSHIPTSQSRGEDMEEGPGDSIGDGDGPDAGISGSERPMFLEIEHQVPQRGLAGWILSGKARIISSVTAHRYSTVIPLDTHQESPEDPFSVPAHSPETSSPNNNYRTDIHGNGNTTNNGSILARDYNGQTQTVNMNILPAFSPPNQPSSTAWLVLPDSSPRGQHYTRLMLTAGEGYPLWRPEPMQKTPPLPEAYRQTGIRIGDIGIIRNNEPFDFLFNITVPRGDPTDPINEVVPGDFTPVFMSEAEYVEDERLENEYIGGLTHSWECTARDRGYNFSTTQDEAALLILPKGSAKKELISRDIFHKFAVENGRSCIEYARDNRKRRDFSGLYLITARERCSAWGMASYLRRHGNSDSGVLPFMIHANATYQWGMHKSGYETKAFPAFQLQVDNMHQNQTVFVRGYRITLGGWSFWRKYIDVQHGPNEEGGHWGPRNTFPGAPGGSGSGSNGSGSGSRTTGSQGNGGPAGSGYNYRQNMSCSPESRAIFGRLTHPCDIINTLLHAIAEKELDGEKWDGIAISHDDDWIESARKLGAPLSPYNIHKFLREVLKNIPYIMDREHNAIYTKPLDRDESNEPRDTAPLEDIIDEVAKEVIWRYCTWFSEGNDQALLIMDTPTPLAHIPASEAAVA